MTRAMLLPTSKVPMKSEGVLGETRQESDPARDCSLPNSMDKRLAEKNAISVPEKNPEKARGDENADQ